MGSFGETIARAAIKRFEAAEWWMHFGESAPHLRTLAIKILSQTTSSSSCERNWSSFALIHTKQRNRMSQKKVERNVFIHYNVRLRLKNMKKARNQGEQPDYCPINLDYIFAEDDPLLPWLENREKEIEAVNSEEDNDQTPNIIGETSQPPREEPIIESDEDSSSATPTDHGGGDDDDDDDDNSGDGHQYGSRGGSASETIVPSTYPYAPSSQSQPTPSMDRGKSSIIEEEEEEDDEEEEEELPRLDSTLYTQQSLYPHYPLEVPQPGIDSYSSLFGYPPQYAHRFGQYHQYMSNNRNDEDNAEEPPRHSFWW